LDLKLLDLGQEVGAEEGDEEDEVEEGRGKEGGQREAEEEGEEEQQEGEAGVPRDGVAPQVPPKERGEHEHFQRKQHQCKLRHGRCVSPAACVVPTPPTPKR